MVSIQQIELAFKSKDKGQCLFPTCKALTAWIRAKASCSKLNQAGPVLLSEKFSFNREKFRASIDNTIALLVVNAEKSMSGYERSEGQKNEIHAGHHMTIAID
mmetsp:Transcript_4649/g.10952  ORF Transcript_4649/g.10952 Transcript_4649/m.10952 type:complete len:103 (+) Transcript_4649:767-1075(+)